MLIMTADGLHVLRPGSPLPDCSTHAVASGRFMEVLGRFIRNEDSRFLDRHWQETKETASHGMTL